MGTVCLDLKALCNAGFNTALVPQREGWGGFPLKAKRLDGLPVGAQVFGRVPFNVVRPESNKGKSFLVLGPEDAEERRIDCLLYTSPSPRDS